MSDYWSRYRVDRHRDVLFNFLKSLGSWLSSKVDQSDEDSLISIFFRVFLLPVHIFLFNIIFAIHYQIEVQSQPKRKRINLRLEPISEADSDSEQDSPLQTDQFVTCGKCHQLGHRNRECPNPKAKRQRVESHHGHYSKK